MICALFTPGITFTEPDHLSGINWDDIDRNFGRKSCAGCSDRLESRVGIAVKCDAGLCKNYFHVTCAQRLGLLIENPNYHHRSSLNHEAGYLYCKCFCFILKLKITIKNYKSQLQITNRNYKLQSQLQITIAITNYKSQLQITNRNYKLLRNQNFNYYFPKNIQNYQLIFKFIQAKYTTTTKI